ncbi:DedA family protein [Streptomyces sp. NPDC004629]|uniref:DedA family protein n=1 Tax=Streptomyces sp. NPDC004629 TaxID=3364705 RepID=UPI0036AB267B
MGDLLWIYPLLAVITLVPLIPNSAALAAAGALAATGRLSPVLVMAIPLTAAVVGDLLVYVVGRCGSPRLLNGLSRYRRWPKHTRVRRAAHHVRRHGVAALIAVRFLPGGRLFGGLTAGLTRLVAWRYACAMCAAEAIFVSCAVGIGYFGGSIPGIPANGFAAVVMGPAVSLIVAVSVLAAESTGRRRRHRLQAPAGTHEDSRP